MPELSSMLKSCREGSLKKSSYSIKLNCLLFVRLAAGKKSFLIRLHLQSTGCPEHGRQKVPHFWPYCGNLYLPVIQSWVLVCCVCGCWSASEIESLAWAVFLCWKDSFVRVKAVYSGDFLVWHILEVKKDSSQFSVAEGLTRLLVEPHERELWGSSAFLCQNWHGALYSASSAHKW